MKLTSFGKITYAPLIFILHTPSASGPFKKPIMHP